MRIVHVTDCYLPRAGGIEAQVAGLAHVQAASGDVVHVITATPARGAPAARAPGGVRVHRVSMRLPFDLPVHPRARHHIARLLRETGPADVVHVHAGLISPFAWSALRAARDLRMPVLVTVHSVWGPWARRGFAMSDPIAGWSRPPVLWSAVSRMAVARVAEALPAAGPVSVVPNGIDSRDWTVTHVPAGDGAIRVASVLRLAPPKRVIPLLRILRAAAVRLGDWPRLRAVIVGDGPERARAAQFIVRHRLGDVVRLAGSGTPADIRALFAETDVYLQPSIREAFGLAALEARAAGLPVIARAESGIAGFIESGVEGILASDDETMADALVDLARQPDVRERMARHNRMTPPPHDWNRVLTDVREAYDAAMRPRADALGDGTARES